MVMKGSLFFLSTLLLCGLCSAGPATALTKVGVCWAMGDPHYRTFDGQYYNFMGNCTYMMAKNCHVDQDHPAFEVEAKNTNAGSSYGTSINMVTVDVYGQTIGIVRSEFGLVRINHQTWNLPITMADGKLKLSLSGFNVLVEAEFGLTVQYDWEQFLMVTVPDSFAERVCGMCGNFNGKMEDDLSGFTASDVVELGESWRVPDVPGDAHCQDVCTGKCQNCKSSFVKNLENKIYCNFLSEIMKEHFGDCQAIIDPKMYTEFCLFDLCRGEHMKKYMCDTLQVYTDMCQRAGVKVKDWRSLAQCPIPQCPENSHYELCGSACAATCEDPNAATNCRANCVETCSCDEGYLRSGNKCVPKSQCGCQYNGRYVLAGESFWGDGNCSQKIECQPTESKITSKDTSCPLGQQCVVVNGIRRCSSMTYATCMVSGDPHYLTFDGERYDFQGTCVYQMAGVCSNDTTLEHFDVIVQNDGRDKKIGSITKLLEIKVYGFTIVISKEHPGLVMVNGELVQLPVTLGGNQVQVYKSGWFAVVQTNFDVKVSYDFSSVAIVTIPSTYAGAMCGLCGNYNDKPGDDLQTKDGKEALTADELGQSWRVAEIPGCVNGCKGPCPDCDITQVQQYETDNYCGQLVDPIGPFRDCHAKVNPSGFFQDCVYDVCLYQGSRNMQCKSLTAYTAACQEKGIKVYPWRSAQFCGVKCPANSHYEICGDGCPASCSSSAAPPGCQSLCMEGCACDNGFLLSGDQCVSLDQCGCLFKGKYYKHGQLFYPNGQCQEECLCNGTVECKTFNCGPHEECEVKNGVRACHPVGKGFCSISGDPHYRTFDNDTYDFQGTCTYTAAQACHLEGTHLTPFTVAVENEKWYATSNDPDVSVAKLVAVEVYGEILILRRNQIGMVMVNGVMTNLPFSLNNGAVQVYQDGTNDVIITDFGLRVTYDLVYHVTVTVPGNYHEKTCGLCGNFNDNKNDEFQLPDGKTTKDVNAFGAAWKVSVPGVVCDDGCSGDFCPKCDESKKVLFEDDCGIITNPKGPFAACHSVIDPASYFRDCVYDVCLAEGNRTMLCHSLAAYMTDCQNFGVSVKSWRSANFCPLSCPANSHYEMCAETCNTRCPGLSKIIPCPATCAEGCTCNTAYYFNGTGCVQLDQCSCYLDGHTYKIGESVVSNNCHEVHHCLISGVVVSQPMKCNSDEICQVQNGVLGCYPRQCFLKSGGILTPFIGSGGTLTTAGAYEIIKVCNDSLAADWFRVVAELENCGKPGLSLVSLYTFFNDAFITVNNKLGVWVNGKKLAASKILSNDISVQVSPEMVVIEKKSSIRLSYSLAQEITLTVSENMADNVCGACGKLTGPPGQETVREGAFTSKAFGTNWIAPDFPTCEI